MNSGVELPKYKCHKEVWALKIKDAILFTDPNNKTEAVGLIFTKDSYADLKLDVETSKRFLKCADDSIEDKGYYVVYKGGYVSWSPTVEFEEGYSLIE